MASSNGVPTSWRPTGRPAPVNPHGTEIAGWPVRLKGRVRSRKSPDQGISCPPSRAVVAPIGGAAIGLVGVTRTSNDCQSAR